MMGIDDVERGLKMFARGGVSLDEIRAAGKRLWHMVAASGGDLTELQRRRVTAQMAADEAIIRHLLGLWVSECEPSVARRRDTNEILGLCVAGDLSGRIVVAVGEYGAVCSIALRHRG